MYTPSPNFAKLQFCEIERFIESALSSAGAHDADHFFTQCPAVRRFTIKTQKHRLRHQATGAINKTSQRNRHAMHKGIYTDFLCKALPMPSEGPSNASMASAVLSRLHEDRIGRVIFTPLYCHGRPGAAGSIAHFINQRNIAFKALRPHLPHSISYTLAAEIAIVPGCFDDPDICRLMIDISGYLPVLLPFPIYSDEVWKDINRLTYHTKYKPIFTNFDRFLIVYPFDEIKKIEKVPRAAFHFNVRSLDSKHMVKYVISLIDAGKTVVFGTGAHRVGRYETEMEPHFKLLRRYLGDNDFDALMLSVSNFCRPPKYHH